MRWFRENYAALWIREFRMLCTGTMLATTAFMMSFILMPAVAYDITGNNTSAGIVQLGSGIGMLLVGPIGGVVADRLPKKPLVFAGQIVPGAVILAIGVLIVSDAISILLLSLGTLIMGFGFAFMGPARQAWVGELVPDKQLPNAVAVQSIAQTISQVLGPLFVAVMVGSFIGVGGTYLFMASLFAIVLPLTALLPSKKPEPKDQPRSIQAELADGLRYIWGNPRLRLLWLFFVAMMICGFGFQTLIPGLLDRELGREPTDVGVIFLSFAVAGLLMNLPLAGVVRKPLAWPALLTMALIMTIGFVMLAIAPEYWVVLLAAIPLGAGRSGFWLINNALLMSHARPEYYGRVMSLAMMAFGSQALLAPVWGALADSLGVRETLFVVAVVAGTALALATMNWLYIRRQPVPAPVPAASDAAG